MGGGVTGFEVGLVASNFFSLVAMSATSFILVLTSALFTALVSTLVGVAFLGATFDLEAFLGAITLSELIFFIGLSLCPSRCRDGAVCCVHRIVNEPVWDAPMSLASISSASTLDAEGALQVTQNKALAL